MLMQNFKSAVDLGITEPQKEALQKTLVLLETGKLKHVPGYTPASGPRKFTGHFNMRRWGLESTECGTVACIGGTAEMVGNVTFFDDRYKNRGLNKLFYPKCAVKMPDITPAQAALRSYLTTGDARWDLAVA